MSEPISSTVSNTAEYHNIDTGTRIQQGHSTPTMPTHQAQHPQPHFFAKQKEQIHNFIDTAIKGLIRAVVVVPDSVKSDHLLKDGPGDAGRPTRSKSVPVTPLSDRIPHPLVGELEEDRDLFAKAMCRPQIYLEARAKNSPDFESFQRYEKKRIKGLPAGMLQSGAAPSRLLGNASRPCKVHQMVDQKLLRALFVKIQNETLGEHFNALVPLQDESAQKLVRDLQNLSAYWICEGDFAKIYLAELPMGYRFQDVDCNGCILAAIGGDLVALEALRISVLTRARHGGRLVAWLDSWIKVHGIDHLIRIKEESARIGEAIRGLRPVSFVGRAERLQGEQRARRGYRESGLEGVASKRLGIQRQIPPQEHHQPPNRPESRRPTQPLRSTIRRAKPIHQSPPQERYQPSRGSELQRSNSGIKRSEATNPSGKPGPPRRFHGQSPERPLTRELQEEYQRIIRPIGPWGREPTLPPGQSRARQYINTTDSFQDPGNHRNAERPISGVTSLYTDLPLEESEWERTSPSLNIFGRTFT